MAELQLNAIIPTFYRTPDGLMRYAHWKAGFARASPRGARSTLSPEWLVSTDVREGIERLRLLEPRLVDAILKGFDEPTWCARS